MKTVELRAAGMSPDVCNHSFRATDITTYLKNSGTLVQDRLCWKAKRHPAET